MEAALKLTPDNPQNGISNEAIQAVLLEMKNKGFENIDDFLAFITQETEQKRKKIELYM